MKKYLFTFCLLATFTFQTNAQEWDSQAPEYLIAESSTNAINNVKVGIGTAMPTNILHTKGQIRFEGLANNNSYPYVLVSAGNGIIRKRHINNLITQDWHLNGNNGVTSSNFIGTINDQAFRIRTNNQRRMTVESDGKVNIFANPNSPNTGRSLLNVYSDENTAYDSLTYLDGLYLFNESTDTTNSKGNSVVFGARSSQGGNSYARAAISGVYSIDSTGTDIDDNMDIVFQNEYAPSNRMRESMRITSRGYVGIGVDAPESLLHTDGEVRFENLPTTNNAVNFIGIDADNRLVITNCQCDNSGSSSSSVSQDEIKALKERTVALENLIDQLINEKKESQTFSPSSDDNTFISLAQNSPNPFRGSTSIEYSLPQSVENAYLSINNMNGQQISKVELTQRGDGSITLNTDQLKNGLYSYSLVVDNKLIDTKKMVLVE